eukprot:153107-Prorocentrum_minimum.AAC.4
MCIRDRLFTVRTRDDLLEPEKHPAEVGVHHLVVLTLGHFVQPPRPVDRRVADEDVHLRGAVDTLGHSQSLSVTLGHLFQRGVEC